VSSQFLQNSEDGWAKLITSFTVEAMYIDFNSFTDDAVSDLSRQSMPAKTQHYSTYRFYFSD
jgi:hypothetical protein